MPNTHYFGTPEYSFLLGSSHEGVDFFWLRAVEGEKRRASNASFCIEAPIQIAPPAVGCRGEKPICTILGVCV